MKISPRLLAVASLIPKCRSVCDIGTDHAYLPIYLVEKGICERAVAADINIGPLKAAEKNIALCGKKGLIETRLSDGFESIEPCDADCIVIAGMGGELIAKILEGRKKGMTRFVLQPQRSFEYLRRYLAENGFEIKKEEIAEEKDKMYCAFYAEYTGQRYDIEVSSALCGKRELLATHPLFEKYIKYRLNAVNAALSEIERGGGSKERTEYFESIRNIYLSLTGDQYESKNDH